MSNGGEPDLSLFLDILHTLDRIGAPYMIIGGFAATMYGSTGRLSTSISSLTSKKSISSLLQTYIPHLATTPTLSTYAA